MCNDLLTTTYAKKWYIVSFCYDSGSSFPMETKLDFVVSVGVHGEVKFVL